VHWIGSPYAAAVNGARDLLKERNQWMELEKTNNLLHNKPWFTTVFVCSRAFSSLYKPRNIYQETYKQPSFTMYHCSLVGLHTNVTYNSACANSVDTVIGLKKLTMQSLYHLTRLVMEVVQVVAFMQGTWLLILWSDYDNGAIEVLRLRLLL